MEQYSSRHTALAGASTETPRRDTEVLTSRLLGLRDMAASLLESVNVGADSLWGGSPEKLSGGSTPKPVANGFFADANDKLNDIEELLKRALQRASHLRNL